MTIKLNIIYFEFIGISIKYIYLFCQHTSNGYELKILNKHEHKILCIELHKLLRYILYVYI